MAASGRETGSRVNCNRHPIWLLLATLVCVVGGLSADKPSVDLKERVKQVGPKMYRVGDVTVDANLRVVAFPAKINQIVGLIEYALVTETGKVHESFLSTKVRPSDIHAALLLLGVKPPSGVSVEVGWKVGGKWVRKPIADCVGQYPLEAASERDDKVTAQSFDLKSRDWKWTGSRRRNGSLTADESGSILSLQPDIDALALVEPMVDNGRFGTHVWPKRVPKTGQMVQVFFIMRKASKP
ncbi:MAG: YdjY domain-containing protein [Verrucomicrobiota bacterium]|nr:YdjY domain-containing protein [Verrucomicrobiota bacterium]